jgi:hypothetical protein
MALSLPPLHVKMIFSNDFMRRATDSTWTGFAVMAFLNKMCKSEARTPDRIENSNSEIRNNVKMTKKSNNTDS